MNAAPCRVLLVEDDASIARFVAMVLEDLPLQLTVCQSAEQAWELARGQDFSLLITDLMLPGMSGMELIERLQQAPAAACPAVVFSAGIDPQTEQRLRQLQVLRILRKPVSVAELLQCVQSALRGPQEGAAAKPQACPEAAGDAQDRLAIEAFFGGDAALFHTYRSACLAQMPHDLAQGQQLLDAGDAQGLRRLAHSLKSVLRLLGRGRLADRAQALEQACLRQDWAQAGEHWQWLQAHVRDMASGQGR